MERLTRQELIDRLCARLKGAPDPTGQADVRLPQGVIIVAPRRPTSPRPLSGSTHFSATAIWGFTTTICLSPAGQPFRRRSGSSMRKGRPSKPRMSNCGEEREHYLLRLDPFVIASHLIAPPASP
jgi:hypothetical protein